MWVHRCSSEVNEAMMMQKPFLVTCLYRVCSGLNCVKDDDTRQCVIRVVDERLRL